MLKGIDISAHQETTPALSGLSFVTIRASIGGLADTRYVQHYANARKAGLVTMAYHYGYPASTVTIAAQVTQFLAVAKDADFLWLDQEEPGFTDEQAQDFINRIRKAGYPCGLYHSASGFGGVSSDGKWVADYRDASVAAGYPMKGDASGEFPNWDFWQYQGSPLDRDYANPARPFAGLLRRGYVTNAEATTAYVEGQRLGYEQGVEQGTLSGSRIEWDRQFTGTNGASIVPLPRP